MVDLSKLRTARRVTVDLMNETGTQRLCDISLGGMRVESSKALRMNEEVSISLVVDAKSFVVRGRVVRARLTGRPDLEYEYGFIFDDFDGRTRALLERFIDVRGSGEAPIDAVSSADLVSMEDRIAELEQELAHAEKAASQTREAMARGSEGRQVKRITDFGQQRFARLLEMDQPLICLVDEPVKSLLGSFEKKLATSFSSNFSLFSVKTDMAGTASHGSIVAALYRCYQKGIIDFA